MSGPTILMIHPNQRIADQVRDAMKLQAIRHIGFLHMTAGWRFDTIIVVASPASTEKTIEAARLEWLDGPVRCCLRPGGEMVLAWGRS